MALVAMTDDGIEFDGRTFDERPLGGTESAFVELAQGLATLGHQVVVRNNCTAPLTHKGVAWAPLSQGLPDGADLYICNRNPAMLSLALRARRKVLWVHNPARYLTKMRHQLRLLRHRPVMVFLGKAHQATYPRWGAAGSRVTIPLGISAPFQGAPQRTEAPPPRAVFTSNPMRSLDWLLEVWQQRIRPAVPAAELHIFSGPSTYGKWGQSKMAQMTPILDRAAAMAEHGVVLRGPVSKDRLAQELTQARALLYRGDLGETFCLAAAESQAMGVPGVVEDIACMAERIGDGESGFVVKGEAAFADAAIRLLSDDQLWLRQHRACLEHQRGLGWAEVAARFAALMD